MQFTPTQYAIYMLALLVVTFISGCSVGSTYRKLRPIAAKKGKK